MTTGTSSPPSPLVTPRLRFAFGGVWRLTWCGLLSRGRLLTTLGALAVFGLLTVLGVRTGRADSFATWAGEFFLLFLLPVGAFLTGAGQVREDLKSVTVDYLFTRPIGRPVFIVFRYIAQLAYLQGLGLLALGVMLLVGGYRGVAVFEVVNAGFLLAQVLGLGCFLALGFLAGAVTSRYLVVGLVYGALIEVGLGQIPMQLNRLSILHHLRVLLDAMTSAAERAGTAAWLVLVVVLLLSLAALTFRWREFGGSQPKEA